MEEVKHTVYLAVGTMLAALVLGLMSAVMYVQGNIATIRNDEIAGSANMISAKKFSKYNNTVLCGDEVSEAIRMYYNEGIDILVDYRRNIKTGAVIDGTKTYTITTNGTTRTKKAYIYNMDLFNNATYKPHFKVGTSLDMGSASNNIIQNWFPTTHVYRASLIYNSKDPTLALEQVMNGLPASKDMSGKTLPAIQGYRSRVGGSPSLARKSEVLSSVINDIQDRTMLPNSVVTGILIINVTDLA